MSNKRIKTISGFLFFILVIAVFILSDNKSSYFAPFAKIDRANENYKDQEQIKSASVSVEPTRDLREQLNEESDEVNTSEGAEVYKVVKVVDGDTMDVDMDGVITRLRIIGVDTAETVDPRKAVQCFGREASSKAKEILSGQYVSLTADESQGNTDKYGRLLRYLGLQDGSDYGLYMISQGYAHEYTYHLPYEKQIDYKQAEIDASSNNRGLWSPSTCSGDK